MTWKPCEEWVFVFYLPVPGRPGSSSLLLLPQQKPLETFAERSGCGFQTGVPSRKPIWSLCRTGLWEPCPSKAPGLISLPKNLHFLPLGYHSPAQSLSIASLCTWSGGHTLDHAPEDLPEPFLHPSLSVASWHFCQHRLFLGLAAPSQLSGLSRTAPLLIFLTVLAKVALPLPGVSPHRSVLFFQ